MMNKDELQIALEDAKRNIEEFRTDAKQARGNMGSMLDNLALGLKNLTAVMESLVEQLVELDAVAGTDESELDKLQDQ